MSKYALTHLHSDGSRRMTLDEACTFATREEAEDWLAGFLRAGTRLLRDLYGPAAIGTFRVDPVAPEGGRS